MATVVERSMSFLSSFSAVPQRRQSIEIIDVDAFDFLEGSSSQPQRTRSGLRPIQRRNTQSEIVVVIDSDDEDITFLPRVLSGHDVDSNRSHRRLISPPPLLTFVQPPPMPMVDPRYAGQTSLPMRRQPPLSPPPVTPRSQPFDFEAIVDPHVAGPSRIEHRAAPPSHHVPTMGLGGAIISSNRIQQSIQRRAHLAADARRNSQQLARRTALSVFLNGSDDESVPRIQRFLNGIDMSSQAKDTREIHGYRQSYTHPAQPEPGFTFDFTIPSPEDNEDVPRSHFFPPTSIHEPIILNDDDESESSQFSAGISSTGGRQSTPDAGKLNALLVCAKCLDPLILNAGLNPEEAQYRRVWGLRCGHLIDEKCLNDLGQPSYAEEELSKDRKGKGKAKAVQRPTYGDAVPELQVPAESEPPNIRARLRSRISNPFQSPPSPATAAGPSSPPFSDDNDIGIDEFTGPVAPPAKRHRGPNKNKKPKVQREFEWHCPVANCGKLHVSVKINGIWGPEKQKEVKGVKALQKEARGAVAIFA